jgi:hypothetical protein
VYAFSRPVLTPGRLQVPGSCGWLGCDRLGRITGQARASWSLWYPSRMIMRWLMPEGVAERARGESRRLPPADPNTRRRHSRLGQRSPIASENAFQSAATTRTEPYRRVQHPGSRPVRDLARSALTGPAGPTSPAADALTPSPKPSSPSMESRDQNGRSGLSPEP